MSVAPRRDGALAFAIGKFHATALLVLELSMLATSVVTLNDRLRALLQFDRELSDKAAVVLSQVNVQLIAAQAAALTAERERAVLTTRLQDLERRVRELEDWESTAKNYVLHPLFPEVWAYAPASPTDVFHLLCPLCFAQRTKSILQLTSDGKRGKAYQCLSCGTVLAEAAQSCSAS